MTMRSICSKAALSLAFSSALAVLSPPASAQVNPAMQAGRLVSNCKLFLRGSGDTFLQTDCPLRIGALLSGWNAGVQRGVRMAFIVDEANLKTTKGVEDVQRRVAAATPTAQCLSTSGQTFHQLVASYIDYVAEKPSREFEDYGQVFGSFIEDRLCSR